MEHNNHVHEVPPRFPPKQEIMEAASFEALYDQIRLLKSVPGTQKSYGADELIAKIEKTRTDSVNISYITRTYGIRDAVERLLATEQGGDKV